MLTKISIHATNSDVLSFPKEKGAKKIYVPFSKGQIGVRFFDTTNSEGFFY